MDFTLPEFSVPSTPTIRPDTAEVTSIRPDLPSVPSEVPKILPAVRNTIEALPWRTNQDEATTALAMNLAQRIDYAMSRAQNPLYEFNKSEQAAASRVLRDVGELLLNVLKELGASPAARANLNVPSGGEVARVNPIAARREANRQNRA